MRGMKMAVPSVVFSGLIAGETALLTKLSSYLSLGLHFAPPHFNRRPVRTVTSASTSEPEPEPEIGKKIRRRRIMKPRRVPLELQKFHGGVSEIPCNQALNRMIWAYIKQHNLQDPENNKIMICDEMLKKIFGGRDRVRFCDIAGLFSPQLPQATTADLNPNRRIRLREGRMKENGNC